MRMIRGTADRIDLPDRSVHCVVTSPPYWEKRVYGDHPDELGHEELIDYVRRLTLIFRELRRVMRTDAIAWLNIGDTAAGSGGAGGDHAAGNAKAHITAYRQNTPRSVFPYHDDSLFATPGTEWTTGEGVLRGGNSCLVPWLLAWHLQGDGWHVRSVVTWDKQARRPEDLGHVRRPGESSEVILMLTPSMTYRFFHERLEEPGDVWHFANRRPPGSPSHFAPFCDELPRRCILPSTEPGDIVLDPFAGSGTTPRVAEELGRVGIGVDLYAEELVP